jgi:hypothetical protein
VEDYRANLNPNQLSITQGPNGSLSVSFPIPVPSKQRKSTEIKKQEEQPKIEVPKLKLPIDSEFYEQQRQS